MDSSEAPRVLTLREGSSPERMRLDTLPTMAASRAPYSSVGFYEIDAYTYNPVPGARYMEILL